jgi:hypothetical protein
MKKLPAVCTAAFSKLTAAGMKCVAGRIITAFHVHGPRLTREAVEKHCNHNKHNGTFSTRITELREKGLLQIVGTSVCEDTGSEHELYERTDAKVVWPYVGRPVMDYRLYAYCDESLSLEEYYKSERWEAFRNKYYAQKQKACSVCGSELNVQLHHRTYSTLGNESFDDVQPLCGHHHQLLHQMLEKMPVLGRYGIEVVPDLFKYLYGKL